MQTHNSCRYTGDRTSLRHVLEHHASRSDFAERTNFHISDDAGAGTNHNSASHCRMAITPRLSGAAQSDILQYGHIILDHGRFTDDDA
jgi:hypothetical protein